GFLGLPRVGTEVLVAFMGGDPDKPVIVGQLYNGAGLPPALGQGELPENRYLSGMKSREVNGGRANQLRFDDTPGEISVQLASDHARSELNVGLLTEARGKGNGKFRGEGAELRSDASSVLRGAQGVLISAGKNFKDQTLLERNELLDTAEFGEMLVQQLSNLEEKHLDQKAEEIDHDLLPKFQAWGMPSGEEVAGIVGVSASQGAFIGSQKSLSVCAKDSSKFVGKNVITSASHNIFMRAMRGISIFAFKIGIKIIAASGNVKIQSQDGDIEIISLGKIKLIASAGIEIQAPQIDLIASGCSVRYADGVIEQKSSGNHIIKSSNFIHEGGSDSSMDELKFPVSNVEHDQRVLVVDLKTEEPLPKRKYRIEIEDGSVIEGETDEAGLTERFSSKMPFASFKITILD
ncbi:type VI secretion system Vgr family protein, partial [Oxalobacteraceae bacterium A2-2]